jgi:hypothetical protein
MASNSEMAVLQLDVGGERLGGAGPHDAALLEHVVAIGDAV